MIRNDEEERGKEQKAHEENVKHLKDLIQEYKNELETILSTP